MPKNNNLLIFTLVIVFLFLLRSAGYFEPFFLISVNFIIIVAIVLGFLILKIKSKNIFLIALIFWLFAGFMNTVHIDAWSERTGIYVYESLLLAILFDITESVITQITKLKPKNKLLSRLISKLSRF